jgi:spore maturation protein CgeB
MSIRVLYVGSLRAGGNGLDRVTLFEAAGFTVQLANRFEYMCRGSRIERSLAARYHIGRGPHGFDCLLRTCAAEGGFDLVFVDKGVWVRPETLQKLRAAASLGLAIHYTPDAQFLENRSRYFFRALPIYDMAITTKPFECDAYRAAGAKDLRLIHQGFGARMVPIARKEIAEELRSEVCFIGHCQPAYAIFLQNLAERVPLAIWGPKWIRYAKSHAWARNVVRSDGVYGLDYSRALSGAKIAIGLLSKRIPETTTTRSFEIPACGTMLLAERTADHQALFEEGVEAEFFDSMEECADKARFYLANDTAREMIAAAGLRRCHSSGYSTQAQFETVIDWIHNRQFCRRPTE